MPDSRGHSSERWTGSCDSDVQFFATRAPHSLDVSTRVRRALVECGEGQAIAVRSQRRLLHASGRCEVWWHMGDAIQRFSNQDTYLHQDHCRFPRGCRGDEIAPSRRMRQERYRRSKRLRHTMHLDDSVGDESMTDMSEPENNWEDDDSVITHISF